MIAVLGGSLVAGAAVPPPVSAAVERIADVPYAATPNPRQTVDVYLPKARSQGARLPVVVFIHGGGWGAGSKDSGRALLQPYVESGKYAGVSVAYRLAGEAGWPAQIHDCKAAIRWIRAKAARFGFDADRIGVVGNSAGGTLATLLGTSGGVADLEGEVGSYRQYSSRVTCVINRFGRLNFLAEPESARAAPTQAKALAGRLETLFRGTLEERADLARRASPIFHVGPDDPPVLTLHGTNDGLVPVVQAEEFDAAMKRAGAQHLLIRLVGAGHGFDHPEEKRRSRLFLDRHLRGVPADIPDTPIVVANKS
jgi:acetyl esterase/lipase